MKRRNMLRHCLLLVFALTFVLCASACAAENPVASGFCGDGGGTNLAWTLSQDGVLTVTGEGATADWSSASDTPFAAFGGRIVSAVFEEGVTRIGDSALAGLFSLKTVSVPRSLVSVGENLLDGCVSLEEIRYNGYYEQLCEVETPGSFGDTGERNVYLLIRYEQPEAFPRNWTVENGVLTFFDTDTVPGAELYGNTPWFSLRDEITEVVIPEGVTEVGRYAFAGLYGLRTIRVPRSVIRSGEGVLYGCEALESFYYGGTYQDALALAESGGIADLGLPQSVADRFASVLRLNCAPYFDNLTWRVEDGVLYIGGSGAILSYEENGLPIYNSAPWAEKKNEVYAIVVEEGITAIDDLAFAELINLQELYLPSTLTEVGEKLIWNDENIYAVYCAFDDEKASRLRLYELLGSTYDHVTVTDEGTSATYRLEEFYPDQVICLGEQPERFVFGAFSFIAGGGRTVLTRYLGGAENCVLPACPFTVGGRVIESYEIAPWALRADERMMQLATYYDEDEAPYTRLELIPQNEAVRSVTVPEGVTVIRPKAFCSAPSLQTVVLPDTLTSIGDMAFSGAGLNGVSVPDSVSSFGCYVFRGCPLTEGVKLPAGIEELPKGIFRWSGLTSYTVPSSVKRIGEGAFEDCRKLTRITLNDGLESIGERALSTTKLQSVILPDSVKSLGARCFEFCSLLENVVWSRDLERIGAECFHYCGKLKTVALPANPISVEMGAFRNCDALETVLLPEGVRFTGGEYTDPYEHKTYSCKPGWVFVGDASLKRIELPESADDIGSCMFSGCTGLERVVIKGAVSHIGEWTFNRCASLRELFLPATALKLGVSKYDADHGWTKYPHTVFGGSDTDPAPYTGHIYFAGTPEQWARLDAPKDDLSGAILHYPETRSVEPTCTAHGFRNAVWYSASSYMIDPGEFVPAFGHMPAAAAATQATATEHGFTEGVYCERCREWLSGHEVIHNTLGECTVVKQPTATEAGECLITCTICGESGLYAMEPVHGAQPGDEADPPKDTEEGSFKTIRRMMRSIIEFFLRLLKWLGMLREN